VAVQVKTIMLDKFPGLDNVNPPEKSNGLQTVSNFFITDENQLDTRQGYARKVTGVPHSLWSDGAICLYREGVYLKRLHEDLTTTSILRGGLQGNSLMRYLSLNGRIYYTDGISTGIIENLTDRTWGLQVPGTPTLSLTSGWVAEGRYQIAVTYSRVDGQESGASTSAVIDVGANGGIIVSLPTSSDATVSDVNLYATGCNGEVLFYVASFPNGTSSVTYSRGDAFGPALKTQFLSPPLVGNLMAHYNGRIYIAQNDIVWYTQLFGYELMDLAENFLPMGGNITMLESVQDGLWVATESGTYFLVGDDAPLKRISKDDAGVIPGTAVKLDGVNLGKEKSYSGPAVLWGSAKYGVCAGLNGGQVQYLTEKRFLFPETDYRGAGLIRQEDNSNLYLLSIYQ
jgi:hypothetical protein